MTKLLTKKSKGLARIYQTLKYLTLKAIKICIIYILWNRIKKSKRKIVTLNEETEDLGLEIDRLQSKLS